MSCENCANAYDEGYTAGHNAENARLRQYAQSGAATFEDLYVRDREIARLREAIGLATTAAPTMEMDAADPVGMMQRVVAETDTLREQADALADALGGVTYSGPICYPEDGGRCHWCEGKEEHGHADYCDWIRGDAAFRTYLGARHE